MPDNVLTGVAESRFNRRLGTARATRWRVRPAWRRDQRRREPSQDLRQGFQAILSPTPRRSISARKATRSVRRRHRVRSRLFPRAQGWSQRGDRSPVPSWKPGTPPGHLQATTQPVQLIRVCCADPRSQATGTARHDARCLRMGEFGLTPKVNPAVAATTTASSMRSCRGGIMAPGQGRVNSDGDGRRSRPGLKALISSVRSVIR